MIFRLFGARNVEISERLVEISMDRGDGDRDNSR